MTGVQTCALPILISHDQCLTKSAQQDTSVSRANSISAPHFVRKLRFFLIFGEDPQPGCASSSIFYNCVTIRMDPYQFTWWFGFYIAVQSSFFVLLIRFDFLLCFYYVFIFYDLSVHVDFLAGLGVNFGYPLTPDVHPCLGPRVRVAWWFSSLQWMDPMCYLFSIWYFCVCNRKSVLTPNSEQLGRWN